MWRQGRWLVFFLLNVWSLLWLEAGQLSLRVISWKEGEWEGKFHLSQTAEPLRPAPEPPPHSVCCLWDWSCHPLGQACFHFCSAVWSPRISPAGLCVPVPLHGASRGSFSLAYSFLAFVLRTRAADSVSDPGGWYWPFRQPLLVQPSSTFPEIQSLCLHSGGGVGVGVGFPRHKWDTCVTVVA